MSTRILLPSLVHLWLHARLHLRHRWEESCSLDLPEFGLDAHHGLIAFGESLTSYEREQVDE